MSGQKLVLLFFFYAFAAGFATLFVGNSVGWDAVDVRQHPAIRLLFMAVSLVLIVLAIPAIWILYALRAKMKMRE